MEEVGEKLTKLFPESHRLQDGINLEELCKSLHTEFTLDCSKGEYEEPVREQSYDKLYEFDDISPHLNFDCVGVVNNNENPNLPFDELKADMTPIIEEKVWKKTLKQGTGSELPPKALVYCHYNAYFEFEELPFDSSYLRQQRPEKFQMGVGQMFAGFEAALSTMKAGEKARFLVDPSYGFGPLGAPPRIPPNASILLDIDLFRFVDCGDIIEDSMDRSEMMGLSFEEYYKSAKAHHLLGNDHFQSKNIPAALEMYKKAEKELLKCSMNNDNEEDKYCNLLLKVYVNMCICLNHPKINAPQRVCVTAREAFHVCRSKAYKSAKLLFNLAKAQLSLSDFEKAKNNLKAAAKLEPHNKDINNLLKQIDEKHKQILQAEKITYRRALGLSEKKKEVPEKEVPEQTDTFEEDVEVELKEFVSSSVSRFDLPPGFTSAEISTCKRVCEKLGLKLNDHTIGGKRSLSVTKC